MTGLELFHLGRRLMKIAGDAMPAPDLGAFAISVRSVLVDVLEHPDSAVGEIAERTGFTQSHVSSSVAALRDSGTLVTQRDPADRRRTLVRAAPDIEHRATAPTRAGRVDEALAAAVDADDPAVVAEVVAMLEALSHHLVRPPSEDAHRGVQGLVGDFDALYDGTPPWDIGRPQPAFQRLADQGGISGRVLDVGCGTGEHTLLAATLGLDALGIDAAPTAIATARRKAADRGLSARFVVHDVTDLPDIGERFDTVLDSGLFHTLPDDAIGPFVAGLHEVLVPGGRYHLLCMSDRQPGQVGPRRVSLDDLRSTFADGWRIDAIEPTTLETTVPGRNPHAWLAAVTRV